MKRILWIFLAALLLTGCGAEQVYETVTDEILQPVADMAHQAALQLPEDAALVVMQNDQGTIYFCDDYTLTLQTYRGSDLDATLRQTTGYSKDDLKLMQTKPGDYDRYDCVWVTTGEGEEQVNRAAILDDGTYHYVLTCMTMASCAEQLQEPWQDIFTSFCLTEPDSDLYTGS